MLPLNYTCVVAYSTTPLFSQPNMNTINQHLRPIRSFVRREGRMTPSQERAFNTLWQQYGLMLEQGVLDLEKIFNRKAPCVLEIGFGMGQSLAQQAEQHSEKNYLGIEVHRPGVGALLAAIENNNLPNIRIFCVDAVEVLKQCLPDESLDLIQIFFPDPWPKRRHNKRRLIQPAFIELLHRKLKSSGKLHLATDWQDYAEQMLVVMSAAQGWKNVAGENNFSPRPEDRPLTKFEKRGEKLGHGVWDLIFEKFPPS